MTNTIALPDKTASCRTEIVNSLAQDGYCILPSKCGNLAEFNSLISSLCSHISFDPARQQTGKPHQMVNAGMDEIGLHIENGNTPKPPRLVIFYCQRAALTGSETTLCDGKLLLENLTPEWTHRLSTPMTVTRTVPAKLWLDYVSKEFNIKLELDKLNSEHLDTLLQHFPDVQAELKPDGELLCTIKFSPIRQSAYSQHHGFANALLGPSINYESPCFRYSDGRLFSDSAKAELSTMAERYTSEIAWQSGDVVFIDNWRVMHGRRAIRDANRTLHIAMGDLK